MTSKICHNHQAEGPLALTGKRVQIPIRTVQLNKERKERRGNNKVVITARITTHLVIINSINYISN